ncbi:MerR family DNA-binding transcriptional regulator [Nonomuraea sp. NPDC002799]
MRNATDLYTIGQLAQRTGLRTRTIRFWSDSGVVPPAHRSSGNAGRSSTSSSTGHSPTSSTRTPLSSRSGCVTSPPSFPKTRRPSR